MRSSAANEAGDAGVPFDFDVRVRWGDVDYTGLINFSAFARFVEVAEVEFFRSLGFDDAALRRLGVYLPRVHLDFDFFKGAAVDDQVTLRTRVGGVGVHSVRLKIEFVRKSDGVQIATSTLVATCVDLERRSVPMPAELATALRSRLASQ
jgi:YbgC/YbaW family acyl-CoA thioester hydrolase